MSAGHAVRRARVRSGLTLRQLSARAETSHSTLAAYEAGRKNPTVATLERIVRAAGFDLSLRLDPRVGEADPDDRGRELLEVLDLASEFPARHTQRLECPVFGRS